MCVCVCASLPPKRIVYQSSDRTARSEIHGDPQFVPLEVRSVVQGDVVPRGVPQFRQERDLFLDLRDVVVGRVEVDHFQRDDGPGRFVHALVHAAVRALADEFSPFEQFVDRGRTRVRVRRQDVRSPTTTTRRRHIVSAWRESERARARSANLEMTDETSTLSLSLCSSIYSALSISTFGRMDRQRLEDEQRDASPRSRRPTVLLPHPTSSSSSDDDHQLLSASLEAGESSRARRLVAPPPPTTSFWRASVSLN